jgi:hypothetical protein
MTNTEDGVGQNGLSTEVVAEIRKQAISEVSKYAVLAFIVLIGIAGSGWWFYLQQKLDEYISTRAAGVPSAAVVAFDSPNGCPKGWSNFDQAVGHTIIGSAFSQQTNTSGGITHNYRDSGGRELHQLTVAELPPLKFALTVNAAEDGNSGGDRFNAGGKDYLVIKKLPTTINTNTIGNGDAFSTMPPYIALFYSKKD